MFSSLGGLHTFQVSFLLFLVYIFFVFAFLADSATVTTFTEVGALPNPSFCANAVGR